MEYLKLIGIVIIVLGFALKFDVPQLFCWLVWGQELLQEWIFHIFFPFCGESFVSNRLMSIFLIIFPVIAIIERYGAEGTCGISDRKNKKCIRRKGAGNLYACSYCCQCIQCVDQDMFSFVRPLILPMSEAAAR